jgi:hypothetical protein
MDMGKKIKTKRSEKKMKKENEKEIWNVFETKGVKDAIKKAREKRLKLITKIKEANKKKTNREKIKDEIEEATEPLKERIEKYHGKKIEKKVISLWPYRLAKSRWAGGNNYFWYKSGKPEIRQEKFTEWSDNGKWSGNSCNIFVRLRREITDDKIISLNGLLTVLLGDNRAYWLTQGKGLSVIGHNGYIEHGKQVEV